MRDRGDRAGLTEVHLQAEEVPEEKWDVVTYSWHSLFISCFFILMVLFIYVVSCSV